MVPPRSVIPGILDDFNDPRYLGRIHAVDFTNMIENRALNSSRERAINSTSRSAPPEVSYISISLTSNKMGIRPSFRAIESYNKPSYPGEAITEVMNHSFYSWPSYPLLNNPVKNSVCHDISDINYCFHYRCHLFIVTKYSRNWPVDTSRPLPLRFAAYG